MNASYQLTPQEEKGSFASDIMLVNTTLGNGMWKNVMMPHFTFARTRSDLAANCVI